MTTQVTQGIKITVKSEYEPSYSDPDQPHFVFSYHISIENESQQTVKLLSRRWEIFDSNGEIREVEGEGVVGHQPVIAPGETYEYESACNLSTDVGKMNGEYTMVREDDGVEFEVSIPEFSMVAPFKLN